MEDFIDQLIFDCTVQALAHLFIVWIFIAIFLAWKMKRYWTFLIASFLTLYSILILSTLLEGWWHVLYMHETYKIHATLADVMGGLLIPSIIASVCSLSFYSVFDHKRKSNLPLQENQTDTPKRKHRMKLKYNLILLLLFLIFLSLSPAFYVGTTRMSRTFYTYNFLYTLFDSTQSFEGESFEEKLAEQTKNSDQSLWEDFSTLIQKEGLFTKEEFERKFGKDLWRNRYNIDYTTNLTGLPENLSEYLSKCPIVIWSNGRNRINERCLGDDIFWPTDSRFNPFSSGTHYKLWKSKTNLVHQPTAE